MKRIAIIGCKTTTKFILDALLEAAPVSALITIGPETASRNDVADYADVAGYAASRGVTVYVAKSYGLNDPADRAAISGLGIDLAFVIGWQRLIPASVLAGFSVGAFGMHGSADGLPRGRGRSPMNWALIEGRERFHTNLFRYDAGVDSGAILDAHTFSIRPDDTAETMHFKNTLAMKRLILKNLEALRTGPFTLSPQKDGTPTFYPKRAPEDSIIDWRNGIVDIERFIRAVAPPFNGAFSFIGGKKVTIDRAAIFEMGVADGSYGSAAPGAVVEVFPNKKWLVRCKDGLLLIHDYRTDADVKPGAACVSPPEAIKVFPTNAEGGHDLPLS